MYVDYYRVNLHESNCKRSWIGLWVPLFSKELIFFNKYNILIYFLGLNF